MTRQDHERRLCCSVIHESRLCCSVMRAVCVAVRCNALQCATVRYSMLQCVAVCRGPLCRERDVTKLSAKIEELLGIREKKFVTGNNFVILVM